MYVLSFYKSAIRDKRFKEAYKKVLDKTENGKIILENPHKSWKAFDFAKKVKVSELATQRWEEIKVHIQKNK